MPSMKSYFFIDENVNRKLKRNAAAIHASIPCKLVKVNRLAQKTLVPDTNKCTVFNFHPVFLKNFVDAEILAK